MFKKKAKLNKSAIKGCARPLKNFPTTTRTLRSASVYGRVSPCCCRWLVVVGDGVIGAADVTVIAVEEREERRWLIVDSYGVIVVFILVVLSLLM